MRVGLIGYKESGKSTLFEWLTQVKADPALAHSTQSAMSAIPEPRVAQLCAIYKPKKVTLASLEIVDTPGLARDQKGNPARIAQLRECDSIVCVVGLFQGTDAKAEIAAFQEELLLADLEIVENRLGRLDEQKKRPLPKTEQERVQFEYDTLKQMQRILESGKTLRDEEWTDEQQKVTKAFRLMSEKPRMILLNTADDEMNLDRFKSLSTPLIPVVAVSVGLERELAQMSEEERTAFLEEMGLQSTDRDSILRLILDASGMSLFLTAGEKEVRTWLIPQKATAVEAAGAIHTDMAKGFIRAEIMRCDDLLRLGSERAVKAENLNRREPKDYVLQDGDIVLFHFSG
ncbi:MAG: DUF933 domain-containing protein [Thermoguttaceae bacterium]